MTMKILFCLFLAAVSFTGTYGQKNNKKITLSGYVADGQKKSIANAIVLIDDEFTDHVTNNKGFYKIKVKSGCTKIGILTYTNGLVEENINGRSVINFTFEGSVPDQVSKNANPESDKVNVGYGTVEKKDLTTTVSKSTRKESNYDSYTSIYNLIRAECPGVQVSGTSIKVQGGATSFSLSSEPLLIVDDIAVNSIENIPPSMVKSVHVLKGSSAAIYGSRGTNGVIIIDLIGSKDRE
jgi:TonB-dependent starch-binding outer membrane protein SusC